jgi:endonuclease YncB( thermonuclease family)
MTRIRSPVGSVCMLFALLTVAGQPGELDGRVVSIADGDTLTVLTADQLPPFAKMSNGLM